MTTRCLALLGRQDQPTDAVEEYCVHLGDALRAHDVALETARVPWPERGWPTALEELEERAKAWSGAWVLVQYTALAWSERGFPLRFLRVLRVLRRAGARVGMVYHDASPFAGARTIDKLRRRAQIHVMNEALSTSELSVFTVPTSKVAWIAEKKARTTFIPVGANVREPHRAWEMKRSRDVPAIAVYGITGGEPGIWEIATIADSLLVVTERLGKVRLVVMGRNSDASEKALKSAMAQLPVEISVLGLLPEEEITRQMGECDVLFFVRGSISSRRGSAIAGIACGLPVVAFEGPETASPITEAGVVFANQKSQRGLGEALLKVLSDKEYRASLAERSRRAQERYFSWTAIAKRYVEALGLPSANATEPPLS